MHVPSDSPSSHDRVEQALAQIRAGKMVILVDDEDRENEGDLCMAAEHVTPDAINFMATYGRGLICVTLTEQQVQLLQLPMMQQVGRAGPPLGTAFTVSIEARHGVTTGISSSDRAHTIRVAACASSSPDDIVTPGHVFPLRARAGGVLVRTGQTEGSVDLARLAGLTPAGVICEIMNDDGSMARAPDLVRFAEHHGLCQLSIADLIEYRLRNDRLIRRRSGGAVRLAQTQSEWRVIVYETDVDNRQFFALIKGALSLDAPALVRVHAGAMVSDFLLAGERNTNLRESIQRIEEAGVGVVVYLPSNTRPSDELAALAVNPVVSTAGNPVAPSSPTVLYEYGLGAQILSDLGIRRMHLLTSNPRKIVGIAGFGLEIVSCISLTPTKDVQGNQ